MATFVLIHRHSPDACTVAFAAWKGFESPLRGELALSSCAQSKGAKDGEHLICWTVEAADRDAALALLPNYVADRTEVTEAGEVPIP